MISVRQKGDFSKLSSYLERHKENIGGSILDRYGRAGVVYLKSYTPKDTGFTSECWSYEIDRTDPKRPILRFINSNIQNGVSIAIILQHGHQTGTHGWVEGRDYINPALQPVWDKMVKELCEEVKK